MGSIMDQERPWEHEKRDEQARKEHKEWTKMTASGSFGSETASSPSSSETKRKRKNTGANEQTMSDTKSTSSPAKSNKLLEDADAAERKAAPVYSGVVRYFPDALVEVARLSKIGNDQHNPGQPLHWAKEKSTDEHDALMRHLIQAGTRDTDGVRHSAKVAWRALAALQRELDAERAGQ